MYSFQTGAGRRKAQKTVRILSVVVFVLAIALIGVTVSYLHASGVSRSTSDALMARATNEANEAQTAVYRLTQSSGTNTMTLLSNVRAAMPQYAGRQHLRRGNRHRRWLHAHRLHRYAGYRRAAPAGR